MDEYNLPLGLDIEKVIEKAGRVSSVLNDLNNQALNVGRASAQAFASASQGADNATRAVASQASAYGTTTRSIENMRDALKDLKQMQFEEKDVSKIRYYNQEIQKLEKQITQTSNIGKAGFDAMGNKIKEATTQTSGLVSGFKNIASALGVAFSLVTIVNFVKELGALAIKADGIERAFSLIGDSQSLAKLREETRGFVSDLELEKLTVKANNFNIPIEKLGGFLDFAQSRAKATGEDVEKLTNNIIDGLGRKSSRIIDNLGISIIDIQKEFKKTGDFTEAVSNLIQREMNSAGIAVDTLADKANRTSTIWANFKETVGGFFAEAFNPSLADNKVIANLTQQQLRGLSDFSKKTAEERTKTLEDQKKKVLELSEVYKKSLSPNAGMNSFGSVDQKAQAQARKFAGEQLATAQNVLVSLTKQSRQADTLLRTQKGILSVEELKLKVTNLREDALNIVPTTDADKKRRSELLKEAERYQAQIDEITGKAQKKRDKEEDSAEKKRLARLKVLNAEKINIQNEFYSAQIEAIEDAETKAVASETVGSQNRVRELENRRKLFPELEKQIDTLIENEKFQSGLRVQLIIKRSQEEEVRIRKASQQEIARVLKGDTAVQIDEINSRYELIRQNAKKAGTFTTENEKALATQQAIDVANVTLKAQDDLLQKQEDLALSGILVRKKRETQSEKAFERENQEAILKINIEFAQKRLDLIASDPAKVEEANKLRKAIQDAETQVGKLGKSKSVDLLDTLGINAEKLKTVTDGVSKAGELASSLFGALADGAKQRVDEITSQIEAIDALISAQEDAVNKEKDLMDKGYANNYSNAQRGLEAQKAQRAELIKQQQEAQKQQQDLQRAQIVADGVAQVSNLITASSEIFKVFSKIPFIGVPLAIAAIGTMFGAFAIAKVSALNSTKLAEGGTIGGKSHAEGGNRFMSLDGQSFLEHERGEEVTKKSSAEKHRKLLKAINKDDFSGLTMNDVSIQDLLKGTGVFTQLEGAKESSTNNINMTNESRTIVVNSFGKSEEYLKSMDKRLASMEKQNKHKGVLMDMGDYFIFKTGNYTQKIWKK